MIFIYLLSLVGICYGQVDGTVRLVNGTNYNSSVGRVEISYGGSWYTVCADDSLCTNAATVVCRQLGYLTTGAQVYGLAAYGQGNGTVGFQNVSCTGSETNVSQCNYTYPSTCSHAMDAAVECFDLAGSVCYQYLGVTGCCTGFPCYVASQGFCYCDSSCHFFGDCCAGIDLTCPAGGGGGVSSSCSFSQLNSISFDGGVDTSGRLRICDNYKWKTVCNKGFDSAEGSVACGSLGLSTTNFTIYPASQYGQGTGDIFAKDLSCSGTESYLTDCSSSDACCGHHHDVGLSCQPACISGQIRFVGGSNPMEGRVEVCNDGRWGTVCDDYWDVKDARVACKMAGFPWAGTVAYTGYYTSNNFGQGTGPIWLDNLQCTGAENSLYNCTANAVGSHNCGHYEDAGAKCAAGPCELANITTCCDPSNGNNCQGLDNEGVCHCSPDCEDHGDCCIDYPLICRCNDYDVRLRGGTVDNEGRVEICINGEWGTVCDDLWGASDAQVVCRQLGYSTEGAQSFSYAYFGYGTGSIWLDNVQCSGSETHLINCSANAVGVHNCGHYEDAGVRCSVIDAPVCVHGQARLARGSSEYEGQLEVCYNGQWGTVCDDFFGQVDANVGCKNIFPSLPSGGANFIQYSYQLFGWSTLDIVMDNVQCTGIESHIVNCTHITNHNCGHYEDVGLACYPPGSYDGQVKLNPGPSAGRLMMFTSNSWGTVCRNSFGIEDARVVCRELNLPTQSPRVYRNLQFGRGYGAIKRRIVSCTGNETHLINCSNSYTYCSHYSDVGVGCEEPCVDEQIRLVDGENATEGRVEICRDGSWGTICDNTASWGAEDARIVCKQLGLPYTAAQAKYFGPGADPYHYSSFDCDGGEQSLGACDRDTTPTCTSHTQDVGVVCIDSCIQNSIRLVDGTSPNEGRLEVCIGGLWGTVCDENFHNVDAQVVCKQLGLPYAGAEAKFDGYFGQGSDHVAITSLYCTGQETSLLGGCLYQTGSAVTCSHANDAGVICQDVCTNGALRLAGAGLPNAGRIEVCYNAEWGTICDKGWDTPDVQVACYQLGFERTNSRAFGGYKYGAGFGTIYFRDVNCTGTEIALKFCTSNTDTDDCDHTDDAGLQCNGAILLPTATPTGTPIARPSPSSVTNVTFTIINSTYAYLTWDPPDQPNGVITGYNVSVYVNNSTAFVISIRGNEAREGHLNQLAPGVPYTLSLTASNVFGSSDPYSQMFFIAELAPNTKVTLTGRRVDENTIFISWIPLTLYQSRGQVTAYTFSWAEYDGTFTQPSQKVTVNADVTSYTISNNIMPTKQYSVNIYATNNIGDGPELLQSEQIIIPTTSSAIFQLKLALHSGQKCGTWTSTSSTTKLQTITDTVIAEVKKRCNGCSFGTEYISNARFKCNPNEEDQATFRAQLFAPGTTSNATILHYINEWLQSTTSTPTISINGVDFVVDNTCQLSISSFDAEYCTSKVATSSVPSSTSVMSIRVASTSVMSARVASTSVMSIRVAESAVPSSSIAPAVGVTVAIIVFLIFGVFAIFVVAFFIISKTRSRHQSNQYYQHDDVINQEIMETDKGSSLYELDQYSNSPFFDQEHDDNYEDINKLKERMYELDEYTSMSHQQHDGHYQDMDQMKGNFKSAANPLYDIDADADSESHIYEQF